MQGVAIYMTLFVCFGFLTCLAETQMVEKFVTDLDLEGSFVLKWMHTKNEIEFELQVKTSGYVGLGFSPNGGMKNSDIVIGWINDDGEIYFSDRHGVGNKAPVEDTSQDYTVLGGRKNGTHTLLRFSRPFKTCDNQNDMDLSSDTVRVIWAYHDEVPGPSNDFTFMHHKKRGVKSLILNGAMVDPEHSSANEGIYWDVLAPHVSIPAHLDTLYWCKIFKAPDYPTKHHITGFAPLIEEKNIRIVHHITLYQCIVENAEALFNRFVDTVGTQCLSKNMPKSWKACNSLIAGWAVGSKGEILPDNVGFPFGEKYGGTSYYLLELHYDNAMKISGIVDNSGLRVYLTSKPREMEGGILKIGHSVTPSMLIPGGRFWNTIGHCSSECTKAVIPEEGINVFIAILHTHLLGEDIYVRHIRDGKELPMLVRDHHYDFNYQQSRKLKKEIKILPGDHLITNCGYNSTRKESLTFGGLGTNDEMCLIFLLYYPKVDMVTCTSSTDPQLLFKAFGINSVQRYEQIKVLMKGGKSFKKTEIKEEKEKKQYETMKKVKQAGHNSNSISMSNGLAKIKIKSPLRIKGKNFLDIVKNSTTWENPDILKRLEFASSLVLVPTCTTDEGVSVERIPNNIRSPMFEELPEEENEECVPGQDVADFFGYVED